MSREQFEVEYAARGLSCSPGVKESYWGMWTAAQEALLAAHGPVTMLEIIPVDEYAVIPAVSWEQLNARKTVVADESYSKGWKDCMEIAKK